MDGIEKYMVKSELFGDCYGVYMEVDLRGWCDFFRVLVIVVVGWDVGLLNLCWCVVDLWCWFWFLRFGSCGGYVSSGNRDVDRYVSI